MPDVIDGAVASLTSIVADLAGERASDILVPNLPGLGITPAVRAHGREAMQAGDAIAEHFSDAVDQALSVFEGIDGPRLHRLDVWKLAEQVRAHPAAAGFVDVCSPCAGRGDCEGYLFWDDVHPTTQAHQRLAEAAIRVLSPSLEGWHGG